MPILPLLKGRESGQEWIGRQCPVGFRWRSDAMGIYGDYLDRRFNFTQLASERKMQLARIMQLRGRDVIVYAADIMQRDAPVGIDYADPLPVSDQLSNLSGTKGVDLILETPGGSGEIAEEIVRMLRGRY